jgi:hypothetical protein
MSETKACPYCGEQVLAAAIKCKHCGSSIDGPGSGAIKKQFKMRPAFVVLGGIVLAVFGAGWAYNWQKTGTPSGIGFSDEAITSINRDIRDEFAKRRGITVEDVQMVRESPRKLTGFAKVKAPFLGSMNKACTATMGDDGRSFWRCE